MIFIKYIDSHIVISIFGLTIRIKNKNVNYDKYKRSVNSYGLNTEYRDVKITASLTSFPARINKVHKTVECILTQTVKPDRLVLWLAESQFPKKEDELPESLLRLREYGLTIGWCENLNCFTKLFPALEHYPNDIIITFDDDIYYGEKAIENLYTRFLKDPKNIYSHRCSRLYIDKDSSLKLCNKNKLYRNYKSYRTPSLYNTVLGYGGVLYPPNVFYSDVLDMQKVRKLCPTQDDIWYAIMAILNGTKTCSVDGFDTSLITVEDTQNCGLCKINSKQSTGTSGQEALDNITKEYPQVIEILKNEKN